jgi:Neutral/alkaline non-lysosomal ceramidase.
MAQLETGKKPRRWPLITDVVCSGCTFSASVLRFRPIGPGEAPRWRINVTAPSEFRHPSFRGVVGIARRDLTPPIGIYSRTWGAALHDTAESIHRPLTLTAMTLSTEDRATPLVLVCADLSFWKSPNAFLRLQERVLNEFSLRKEEFIFSLSHTHAAPPLQDVDDSAPGGRLLREWIESITVVTIDAVKEAIRNSFPATVDWHTGSCHLATVRDFPDPERDRYLCGYAPNHPADETLLVGRVTDDEGAIRATLVNYACHPTTLAWENKAISPDYIGSMRETIERVTKAPALFLLGACGDLAPREQYTADLGLADRHGRQLGFAALATLEDMVPAETRLVYSHAVESGAPLAVWKEAPTSVSNVLKAQCPIVSVPLKNWPTTSELEQQIQACTDRALRERLIRKRATRLTIGDASSFPLPIWTWRIGDAVIIGSCCEFYSVFQKELRRHFPDRAIICLNIINGSTGYLPPAELYDRDIYSVWVTPFDRGSLETAIEAASNSIRTIVN